MWGFRRRVVLSKKGVAPARPGQGRVPAPANRGGFEARVPDQARNRRADRVVRRERRVYCKTTGVDVIDSMILPQVHLGESGLEAF